MRWVYALKKTKYLSNGEKIDFIQKENKIIFITQLVDIFVILSINSLNIDHLFQKTKLNILTLSASQVHESWFMNFEIFFKEDGKNTE